MGGLGATLVLWGFVGPTNSYVVLGFRQLWIWFAFPIVGGVLSGFWATLFRETNFGIFQGAFVSLLAFVTFCALLASVGAGTMAFIAFVSFGFILIGWAMVLLGGVTGWLFRRQYLKRI